MRKILAISMVFVVILSVGCFQRPPERSYMYITHYPEEIPQQYYLNGQAPREEQEETEQPPESIGEVQVVRSPIQEGERIVALTFDDGPAQHTGRILDLLEEHGGAATFFVLGYRVQSHSATLKRMMEIGSEIAGHSWDHPDFSLLTEEEITRQIKDVSEAIEPFIEEPSRIFRPPYGRTNELVKQVSKELGYAIINWTLDPRDWEHRDADHIYNHIMSNVQSGDIILMHDIYASTLEAAERIIPRLIEEGYRLVTVSELLVHLHGEIEPGVVYGRDYDAV